MNFEKLLSVLQLVPALVGVIKAVEEFVPVSGAGKEKLEVVRQTIEDTYADARAYWPYLEKIISRLVGMANTFGVFKKEAAK